MVQRLVIEGTFITLNDLVKMAKRHWKSYAGWKKASTDSVGLLALLQGLKPVEGRVVLHFHWYEKDRRRDPDNLSAAGRKPTIDGLVKAGVLPNDGWKTIQGLEDRFFVDKDRPRVEVEIEEVEGWR